MMHRNKLFEITKRKKITIRYNRCRFLLEKRHVFVYLTWENLDMLKDFTFKDIIFQGQTIIEKGAWVQTMDLTVALHIYRIVIHIHVYTG